MQAVDVTSEVILYTSPTRKRKCWVQNVQFSFISSSILLCSPSRALLETDKPLARAEESWGDFAPLALKSKGVFDMFEFGNQTLCWVESSRGDNSGKAGSGRVGGGAAAGIGMERIRRPIRRGLVEKEKEVERSYTYCIANKHITYRKTGLEGGFRACGWIFEQLPLLKRPIKLVSSVAIPPPAKDDAMDSPWRLPLLALATAGRWIWKLKAFPAARVGDRIVCMGEVPCVKLERRLRRRGRPSRLLVSSLLAPWGDATGVVCCDRGVGVTLLRVLFLSGAGPPILRTTSERSISMRVSSGRGIGDDGWDGE